MAHFLERYKVVNSTPVYGVSYEEDDEGIWVKRGNVVFKRKRQTDIH